MKYVITRAHNHIAYFYYELAGHTLWSHKVSEAKRFDTEKEAEEVLPTVESGIAILKDCRVLDMAKALHADEANTHVMGIEQ